MYGRQKNIDFPAFLGAVSLSVRLHCCFSMRIRWIRLGQGRPDRGRPGTSARGHDRAKGPTQASSTPDVLHPDVAESERRALCGIVESLSPAERLICFWRAFGFSKQQIAKESGWSINGVETILRRTTQRLREGHQIAAFESKGREP
jgi:DNA-directed RNA polymerase specialized sigma24 family protein